MSPDGHITAERVWKRFRAERRRRLLRDRVDVLDPRGARRRGWRWALRDVEFTVPPGEAVGLIGNNGSGKSTLLRILARVSYPSAGHVAVGGRVGALIEVRAGIHPDLTGRENIGLYGSLLGLRRSEVDRRFDDIVAFAELEEAIDRRVKFFSSGMQMRLGFAVVAFLQPDVLLVDEVLAVGDAAFQQRCLERMSEVLSEGTTLVFVSHDLPAVEAMCSRGLWLRDGVLAADGPVREVTAAYRAAIEEDAESVTSSAWPVRLVKAGAEGGDGGTPANGEPLRLSAVVRTDDPHSAFVVAGVTEGTASPIFTVSHSVALEPGDTELEVTVDELQLPRGRYYLWLGVWSRQGKGSKRQGELLPWRPAARFDVTGPALYKMPTSVMRLSPVQPPAAWHVERR